MKSTKPVPTVPMGRYMAAREIAKQILSGNETVSVTKELMRDLLGDTKQLQPSERLQIYGMMKQHTQVKESGLWRDLVQFSGAREVIDIPNFDGIATAQEFEDCSFILHLLSCYCSFRASACGLRLKGDIDAAKSYEAVADKYYQELPEWARW